MLALPINLFPSSTSPPNQKNDNPLPLINIDPPPQQKGQKTQKQNNNNRLEESPPDPFGFHLELLRDAGRASRQTAGEVPQSPGAPDLAMASMRHKWGTFPDSSRGLAAKGAKRTARTEGLYKTSAVIKTCLKIIVLATGCVFQAPRPQQNRRLIRAFDQPFPQGSI